MEPQTNGICVHEPLEPHADRKGWYVLGIENLGIYIRICKHCHLLYSDLTLAPHISKEIN